ncbi:MULTISPECIES: hypothetical protein [unclassified Streptomyces]|uniref:hypothetical protein n=1 Tax=unclassified Streptomyces TaxID=2593676 RepID=UPI000DD677DD|nr:MULTISPECIES: hypothetical protein [unclassified Streptomyces]QZZ26704.1 hypothetical protein A7X85_10955 [Streptomyces sp. ST1015]
MNSGPGPQYNNIFYAAAESRLRSRPRPRSIAEPDRAHLAERFVPPTGLRDARLLLDREHTVLLDGPSGSGRRSAAVMLLHELPGAGGSLHELPDTSDDKEGPPLDTEDIGEGDRLLLDLSATEESHYLAFQDALTDFRTTLIARRARLAVVLPHSLAYLLRSELRHLKAELSRPDPLRVLARQLRCDGVPFTEEDLSGPDLASTLTAFDLDHVARLAHRIRDRWRRSPADRGFPEWLASALADSAQDRQARTAVALAAARSGRERALLLSLAVFHEATPEVLLGAANGLLRILSHPPDETPRLDRTDLFEELAGIGAEAGAHGLVHFKEAEYDRAAREHFWTYFPDIRHRLRDWFRDSAAAAPPEVREAAVGRFATEVLRVDRQEDLTVLAEEWGRTGGEDLVPEAAQALAEGLENGKHGRYFRQKIYEWSLSHEIPAHLREALIAVCSQTMAASHPDQALVRLHHLDRRSYGRVGDLAHQALLTLARSDDRLYRLLLERLRNALAPRLGEPPRQHRRGSFTHAKGEADRRLFLDLADPLRLTGNRRVQDALAACWSSVLHGSSWEPVAVRWLDACADPCRQEPVLRVLAAAVAHDARTGGRLYSVARGWQRAGGSAATVARLLDLLDVAQGYTLRSA